MYTYIYFEYGCNLVFCHNTALVSLKFSFGLSLISFKNIVLTSTYRFKLNYDEKMSSESVKTVSILNSK